MVTWILRGINEEAFSSRITLNINCLSSPMEVKPITFQNTGWTVMGSSPIGELRKFIFRVIQLEDATSFIITRLWNWQDRDILHVHYILIWKSVLLGLPVSPTSGTQPHLKHIVKYIQLWKILSVQKEPNPSLLLFFHINLEPN